jgi:hypothetical protein
MTRSLADHAKFFRERTQRRRSEGKKISRQGRKGANQNSRKRTQRSQRQAFETEGNKVSKGSRVPVSSLSSCSIPWRDLLGATQDSVDERLKIIAPETRHDDRTNDV